MVVFFQQADVFIFVGEYLHQYGLIDRIRIGEHFHGFFNSAVSCTPWYRNPRSVASPVPKFYV